MISDVLSTAITDIDHRGGELLASGEDIAAAIRRVGEYLRIAGSDHPRVHRGPACGRTVISSCARWLEHPRLNDAIQDLAGRQDVHGCIRVWLSALTGPVVDVGGGTGRIAPRLPQARYLALDPDARRRPAIVGQAQRLPLGHSTMAAAMMVGMIHHLSDATLDATLDELQRVLVPRGTLIVLEPVLAPHRLMSRLLWSGDRGGWPRSARVLYDRVASRFPIQQWCEFSWLHAYVALRAVNWIGRSRHARLYGE